MWTKSKIFLLLLILLSVICILKGLYIQWYINNNPYYKAVMWDSTEYDAMAQEFLNRSFWKGNLFILPPGYPLFLSLVYKLFGHSYFYVLLIQNALTLLSLILLFILVKNLFNETIALFTVTLYGFYGVINFYDNKLMDNSLVNFLLILFAYFSLSFIILNKSMRNLFLGALSLGFASITKPNFLLLAFFFLFFLIYEFKKKALKSLLIFSSGVIIVLIPITVRNYIISKDFILISPYGALAFYDGNRKAAKPYFEGIPFSIEVKPLYKVISKITEDEAGFKMMPSQISSFYYKKAFNFIVNDPYNWLKLIFKKFVLSFGNYEQELNYSYDLEINTYKRYFFIPFSLIISLGIIGIFLSGLHKKNLLFLLIIITVYATLLLLYMIPRLRAPAIPFLCVFAASSLERAINFKSIKKKIIIFIIFITIFLGSLKIKPPYTFNLQANEYMQYGMAYLKLRKFSEAEFYLKKAVGIEPSFARGYMGLGLLYKEMQQDQKSLEYYKIALKYNDADAEIHNNIASLYFANNNLEKAEFHLTRGYQLNPYHPSILFNMAILKLRMNKIDEAKKFYQQAIALGARDKIKLWEYFQ